MLIEEATLLRVIAGDYVADAGQYERMKELADGAVRGVHYRYRRGVRRLEFSAVGLDLIQQTLGVTDLEDFSLLRVAQQVDDAFVAKDWLRRGVDYEVRDGGVHPVPSLQRNIRYETGILQAIEAREDLFVSDEALPLARIRVSDYFRLYGTLTGFASLPTPELATELRQRYNIELLDIPEDTTPAEDSVRGGKPWSRLPGWPRRRAEDTDPSLRDKRSRDDRLTAIENQHFEQITALRLRFLETANPQDDIKRILDDATLSAYGRQEERLGHEGMDQRARAVPLAVLAKLWSEHLAELDILMQRYAAATQAPGALARYETAAASRYTTMLSTFPRLVARYILDQ